jgi:O-antigen ligase
VTTPALRPFPGWSPAARDLVRVVVVTGAAAAAGWLAAANPGFLTFQVPLSWGLAFALIGAVAVGAAIVSSPALGLCLLVAFVYLNLSQVLVRSHELPSLLQLLALPMLAGAWRATSGEDRGRALRHPVTVVLALYLAVVLASTTWARDTALADARVTELAKAFAVFALTAILVVSLRAARAAVWTLVGAGALLSVLAVIQAARGGTAQLGGLARIKQAHIYGDVFEPRIAGPLGDPNFFAQILVMAVPLALFTAWDARDRWSRTAAYGAAGLLIAATVVTYSRGGALALGCVLVLALLARREHFRQAAAGLLAVALLWTVLPRDFTRRLGTIEQVLGGADVLRPDSSFQKRRLLTRAAWLMFADHPLVGVGAANYTTRFDEVVERVGFFARDYEEPGDAHYPHNLYLEMAAETGLAGLVCFAGALVASFAALRRAQRALRETGDRRAAGLAVAFQVALAGYLVSSLFLHGHFPRYLWMLLGFAVGLDVVASRLAARRTEPRLAAPAGEPRG